MNTASKPKAAYISGLILSALTLLLAALLIIQCVSLYAAGSASENLTETGVRINDAFSRELVAQRLGGIAWAFWLWLVSLIAAVVCRAVSPRKESPPKISPGARLALMRARVEATPAMLAEEKKRRAATAAAFALCLISFGLCALYLADTSNFASRDLEGVMGAMLSGVGPWVLLAFLCLMLRAEYVSRSYMRETLLCKDAPKPANAPEPTPEQGAKPAGKRVIRIVIYAAAVALIAAGIVNGGMYDVLVKAVNICTECIGLG